MSDWLVSFDFSRPAWLLAALVALPLVIYYYRRSLVDFSRRQMLISTVLRIAIVLLLVLALAGWTLVRLTREQFVVFAIDRSASMGEEAQEQARKFIEEAQRSAGPNRSALLHFAAQPTQPQPTRERLTEPQDRNGSDLAAAIETAVAAIPPDYVPHVVLLSDGNQTSGDALRAALRAGVPISTRAAPARREPEVQVSAVNVPPQAREGEPFPIEVVIDSNHDDDAQIEVFRGAHRVINEQRKLKAGENRLKFTQSITGEKLAEYSVRLYGAKQDTFLDNNTDTGLVFASGKPRVLLVDSDPQLMTHLVYALQEEGIEVEVRPPSGVPETLADLQNFELLALSNVPATSLRQKQMETIRSYVQDLGGGFLMLGGDQSFGLGGYYKTSLEEILPVRSDFEKEKEKPRLAMIIVLDKSGSMGGDKIEMAKQAAASAVELLGPQDQIGLIAFEGETFWVCDVQPAANRTAILDDISRIEAGGGTDMYPALDEAYAALDRVSAKLKHVIVLTDGISAPGDFLGIATAMAGARMTLSTVAVGDDADLDLLEQMAYIGHGRHYHAQDAASVPQIFAKETVTASKSAINEQPFTPQVMRPTQALADIEFDSAPFLLGYVVTRPKPTCELVLATEQGDPLLAWWRYGLGMSAAFTSDAKARWAAEWLTWPSFSRFWAQVVRQTMRKGDAGNVIVEVERQGNKALLRLDSVDATGRFINQADSQLTIIDPRLQTQRMPLQQTAPGRYVAQVDLDQSGPYHFDLLQRANGQMLHHQSRGLYVGYPDELRLRKPNTELLGALSAATGGRAEIPAAEVFAPSERTAERSTALWPYLAALAACLLVLDVALRRLDLSSGFEAPRDKAGPAPRAAVKNEFATASQR